MSPCRKHNESGKVLCYSAGKMLLAFFLIFIQMSCGSGSGASAPTAVTATTAADLTIFPTLEEAVRSSTAGKVIQITSSMTAGDLVIPEDITLSVAHGAMITVSDGKTVKFTRQGQLVAGGYQIFNGKGAVSGLRETRPEWFGAKGDGTTDDGEALIKMWESIDRTNGSTVTLTPDAVYFITKGGKVYGNNLTIVGYKSTIRYNGHLEGASIYGTAAVAEYTIPNFERNCAAALLFWDGVTTNYALKDGVPVAPTTGNTYKNISIYGLTIDGGGEYNTNSPFYPGTNWREKSYQIFMGAVDGLTIQDCTFKNSNNESIRGAFYANNVLVKQNKWVNCGHNAINFMSLSNSVVSDNNFEDVIQVWEGPAYKVAIQNNTVSFTSRVSGKGGQLRGFWIVDIPTSPSILDVSITNNTLRGSAYPTTDASTIGTPIEASWTVKPFAAQKVTISNNTIEAKTKNGKGHVWVRANPGQTTISNNKIVDQGQVNTTTTGIIDVDNSALHSNFMAGSIAGGTVDISQNTITVSSFNKFSTIIYLGHLFNSVSGGTYAGKVENNTVRLVGTAQVDQSGYLPQDGPYRDSFIVKLCDNIDSPQGRLQTFRNNAVGAN